MHRLAGRFSYANVMSTVAVFLALGGVTWAATRLPRNSVGVTQLRKNSVTGAKVRNGSLTSSDLMKGTLKAGPAGALGPAGIKGEKGDAGAQGATGPSDAYTARRSGSPLMDVTTSFAAVVTTPTLPAGSYTLAARANVIGGGGVKNALICSLENDAAQNFNVASGDLFPLSMASTQTLTAAGTVSLQCNKSAGTPTIAQATIIATRVGTLTGG